MLVVETTLSSPPPVSINDAYTTFRGKRNLTAAGRHYKDALGAAIGSATLDWKTGHDAIYKQGGWATLEAHLYLTSLRNAAWIPGGSKTKGGKERQPWKVQDASNYVKLLEDAVASGSGIDDCNTMRVCVQKHFDTTNPRIFIRYTIWKGHYE